MSIIFANITYDVCKKLGADYSRVYDTITQRDCFTPHYLMAHEKLRGYGGHCLPKDTAAWNKLIQDLELEYTMIQSVIDDNERLR
jgi:UDPglucose 6-dehydrogenase